MKEIFKVKFFSYRLIVFALMYSDVKITANMVITLQQYSQQTTNIHLNKLQKSLNVEIGAKLVTKSILTIDSHSPINF